MSECRSCGAKMIWAVSLAGRRIPIDGAPLVEPPTKTLGVFALLRRTGHAEPLALPVAAVGLSVAELWKSNVPLFVSHFATCPNADAHRGG